MDNGASLAGPAFQGHPDFIATIIELSTPGGMHPDSVEAAIVGLIFIGLMVLLALPLGLFDPGHHPFPLGNPVDSLATSRGEITTNIERDTRAVVKHCLTDDSAGNCVGANERRHPAWHAILSRKAASGKCQSNCAGLDESLSGSDQRIRVPYEKVESE